MEIKNLKVDLCSDAFLSQLVELYLHSWFLFIDLTGIITPAVLNLKRLALSCPEFISMVCLPAALYKLSSVFTGLSRLPG